MDSQTGNQHFICEIALFAFNWVTQLGLAQGQQSKNKTKGKQHATLTFRKTDRDNSCVIF